VTLVDVLHFLELGVTWPCDGSNLVQQVGEPVLGARRAKALQDAPGIPEEHLLLVESGEVMNDVVGEIRPAASHLDIHVWGDKEIRCFCLARPA
jgi:hypothetical protein